MTQGGKGGWKKKSRTEFGCLFLQVAALAISSANGLVLKGGKEATLTNEYLQGLVTEALEMYGAKDAVSLVSDQQILGEKNQKL